MRTFPLTHIASVTLRHAGECSLLGVTPERTIFVEEMYGDHGWLAQHHVRLDGTFIESIDEQAGQHALGAPLTLPDTARVPRTGWHTMALNYAGPRHRGLREPERLLDMLRPISISDKIALVAHLRLNIAPPLLLGVAESYVLSEAEVLPPDLFFVCRRLRLALALPAPQIDENGLEYDYDTLVIHAAHYYDRAGDGEPALIDALTALPGATLRRPTDCVVDGDYLYISDAAGSDSQRNQIHVWRIDIPAAARRTPSEEERIYG